MMSRMVGHNRHHRRVSRSSYETPEAIGASEPEGDVTSVPIDVPDGHAFLVTANGADGQPMTLPAPLA